VREDSVAAGGACLVALGLDHSRKPGESAAALSVGHQLVRHQIDVIDQNERDACGRVRRRAGKADAADWNKQKAGSKTAVDEEHGGMLLVSQSEVHKPLSAPPDAALRNQRDTSNFYDFRAVSDLTLLWLGPKRCGL
jgi:hypothetical protein